MSKRLGIIFAGALVLGFGTIGKVTAQESCVGDCNGDLEVTIDEIITCVNIALDLANLDTCPSCDGDGDGEVTIAEIITSVNIALDLVSCMHRTPTVTATPVRTRTPTMPPSSCPCDVTGMWRLEVTQTFNTCGEPNGTEIETTSISQDEDCVVRVGAFPYFRGVVASDCVIEFDYEEPEDGGMSRNVGRVVVDGCMLEGENDWVFRDGDTCNGHQDISGEWLNCK
jgi:hypothetical protein